MAPPPVLDGERGARLIQLGVFGAPQGVRGEIRVKSFTRTPADISAYGALTDERGGRTFTLKVLRALKDDMVVARVDGVLTRDAAAALTHVGCSPGAGNCPRRPKANSTTTISLGFTLSSPTARPSDVSAC